MDFLDVEVNGVYLLVLVALFLAAVYYLWPKPSPKPAGPKLVPVNPPKQKQQGIAKKQTRKGPPLKVLWGSQTGTAEDFAETLCTEAIKHGFAAESIDLEEYDKEEIGEEEALLILVVATYGEGEPTDNAKDFYEWITDSERETDLLSSVKYTVFGLGNTTYEHYNSVGRTLDKRFEELGARRIYPKGEGDDDSSLEEDFLSWKKGLWQPLCELFNLEMVEEEEESFDIKPRTRLVFPKEVPSKDFALGTTKRGGTYDLKNPYIAELVVNRELHGEGSDRSCRHIEFEIGDILRYETGDHLGVYPKNQTVVVEHLAKRLGCIEQLDSGICLYSNNSKPVLGPCTLRTAFSELLDITSPPRKALLRALVQYAKDPSEKEFLATISSSKEDSLSPERQYASWIKQSRRTVGEVLEHLPSVSVPLGHMLELLPLLAPRYYSISSSPLLHPNRIHITCVVTTFVTGTGRLHKGVASNHFLDLIPSEGETHRLPIFVRKSGFRMPKNPSIPMIMVGPGTGLAPFRGFIQEMYARPVPEGTTKGEAFLFFGCRNRQHDFLYQDELHKAVEDKHLTELIVAFSREQDQKVYVQDKIRENKEKVWELIGNKNAHVYICGDAASMAPDVRRALEDIVVECGGLSAEDATAYISRMHETGRFATDVWF